METNKSWLDTYTKNIKLEAYREFAGKVKLHRRKMSSADFSGEFWDYAILEEDIYATLRELEGKLNEKI
jgi:hypothetical protein